ncbi:unnamed protein product [Lampetra fluviatilis]
MGTDAALRPSHQPALTTSATTTTTTPSTTTGAGVRTRSTASGERRLCTDEKEAAFTFKTKRSESIPERLSRKELRLRVDAP